MRTALVIGTGPHRHLRRARPRRARRRRPPRRPRPRAGPYGRRARRRHGRGARGPGRPRDRRRAARARGRRRSPTRMRRGLARGYLDVASVKGGPRRELEALGLRPRPRTSARHPMSGREKSGPLAATADLFEGRPWVLTPDPRHRHRGAQPRAGAGRACRAVPVVMDADAHDRAVALVSHTPAAGLQHGRRAAGGRRRDGRTAVRPGHPRRDPDRGLRPRGCGSTSSPPTRARSPTSSPTSPPTWTRPYGRCARCSPPTRPSAASGAAGIEDVLRRGNAGPGPGARQARRGSARSTRPWRCSSATSPGELARIFADAGAAGRQHRGRPHRARHGAAGGSGPADGRARRRRRC